MWIVVAVRHVASLVNPRSVIIATVLMQVQQNACGALRNMVYGKNNDESKILVRNCGGIASLSHVLRTTDDHDMKELITGVKQGL